MKIKENFLIFLINFSIINLVCSYVLPGKIDFVLSNVSLKNLNIKMNFKRVYLEYKKKFFFSFLYQNEPYYAIANRGLYNQTKIQLKSKISLYSIKNQNFDLKTFKKMFLFQSHVNIIHQYKLVGFSGNRIVQMSLQVQIMVL